MKRFSLGLLFAVCGLAFVASVRAQGTPVPPRPATLRFLVLEDRPAAYFVQTGRDDYQQITSSPYAISTPYTPPDVAPVAIYRKVELPTPATPGAVASPYVKVASVTPSITSPSTLIVLVPEPPVAPSTTPTLRPVVYNTDPATFPAGSVRVINLGRAPMAVQLGSASPLQVAPGNTQVASVRPDAKNRVPARIGIQDTDGWRILSNKILTMRPGHRITGVVVYSPSGMRHTYTREEIAEFGPPKPAHVWLTFTDTPPASAKP